MSKRIVTIAAALTLLAVLPTASASAAEPWWQVLTGSRPTNLWEPVDAEETQEVSGMRLFGAIFAAKVTVAGEVVGCLGSGSVEFAGGPSANTACEEATGFPASETAEEFEEMLEGPYGTGRVSVTGGSAGSAPFEVVSPWGPPISLSVIQVNTEFGPFPAGESVSSKATSEGSGRLVLTLTNLGDEPVDGSGAPVRIVDKLPAVAPRFGYPPGVSHQPGNERVVPECVVEAADEVACTYEGQVTPFEALEVEVLTALTGSPPVAGAPGEVTVSGGNARSVNVAQHINVSDAPVPFGVEQFTAVAEEEGGAPATRAGSHPFQFTTTLQLSAGRVHSQPLAELIEGANPATVEQPALPRNLRFPLPAGLVGNASAMPECDMQTFLKVSFINSCPDGSVVGAASVTVVESKSFGLFRIAVPVLNLPPANGEPARFGFVAVGVPVIIDTSVDPDDGYRITASVSNVSQLAEFLSATTTFWGAPGDPRHDNARGWNCVYQDPPGGPGSCVRPANLPETAFMRMPVQCSSPLDFGLAVEPWNVPLGSQVGTASFTGAPLEGCNQVPFNPTIHSSPTSKLAENPSGLDFQLDMPNSNLLNKDGIAEAQAKKVEVALPAGMSINPSQGEGLVGCSPDEYARETVDFKPGEGCPDASKVGTVQISTPLLKEEARGSLYVASPHDNPFGSLLALYMVAKIPERGIVIKQAGKVATDPVTGQITTTFDDLPQLPFSSFKLQFRPGARAPLATPPACGNYDVVARFTPWSAQDPNNPAPDEIVTRTSSFTVEHGVDGGACPAGGTPGFHPNLDAGTLNNAAGRFSPFNLRLTRKDGEQEFTNFSIKLPPGVIGKLAGIPFCSDGAIAASRARTGPNGGQEELDSPSCPAASAVGRTLVGAGVGTTLTYVPGKVYLAGPYHGSPLSIAAITAAKVGPFDLGTVVVREALRIDPDTAEVFVDATGSDPIPHIIQGIQVHARDIRVYVDRDRFVLNPTSCERTSTASTVLGSGLDFGSDADNVPVTVTSPFQAADCASLPFRPRLKLRLLGGTKRGANPKLRATLRMKGFGEAAISQAAVTLPHSEFLDQSHIRTVCTRVQFKAGAGNGSQCPKGAVYGYARAWTPILDDPITGPVYLRSSSHPLPDLVAALEGKKININLVGRIDSAGNGRIRNTFEAVPDAPVTKFVLEMQGGKKGLLQNSTNLCNGRHQAAAVFEGHNGKQRVIHPALKGDCKGRKGGHRGARHGR
jgi:hypothetical protein